MAVRVARWLSIGVLAGGLLAAALAGPSTAIADPSEGSDTVAGTSQESAGSEPQRDEPKNESKSVGKEPDSVQSADTSPSTDSPSSDDEDINDEDSPASTTITGTLPAPAPAVADDVVARRKRTPDANPESTPEKSVAPSLPSTAADDRDQPAPIREQSPVSAPEAHTVAAPAPPNVTTVAPALTVAAVQAARQPDPPAQPTLINILGTIFFTFFDAVNKLASGPPAVPPNSTVRVGRSTLLIDCGDGYTADADWYVPTSQEPPQGLIYFQHGILAQGGYYNVTAARLAETTNSIVVVPTITSNIFACDSCFLVGDPMHLAVAKLFSGDRVALATSLAAAFPDEDITIPRRYVLAGHSAGTQLAAGAAGFASQLAGPGGSGDLAGVLLFDTNDVGGFLSRGLAKVPTATPVYYIGADPALLNNFAEVPRLLQQLRPGRFIGVQLVGGVHGDSQQSTNALVSLITNAAFGPSRPENAAAAVQLAAGWIDDMFSSTPDVGVHPEAGATIRLATSAGTATVTDLRGPLYQPSPVESLISFLYGLSGNLRLGFCAPDVDELLARDARGIAACRI